VNQLVFGCCFVVSYLILHDSNIFIFAISVWFMCINYVLGRKEMLRMDSNSCDQNSSTISMKTEFVQNLCIEKL
jgi:hypothetical protein